MCKLHNGDPELIAYLANSLAVLAVVAAGRHQLGDVV